MNKFEAVILYSPVLTTSDQKNQEDWGLRNLSYKIKKFKKAFYKFYQLEIEGTKIQDIKKNINRNEQIIRHLFVKVENHEKLPTKILKEEK